MAFQSLENYVCVTLSPATADTSSSPAVIHALRLTGRGAYIAIPAPHTISVPANKIRDRVSQ